MTDTAPFMAAAAAVFGAMAGGSISVLGTWMNNRAALNRERLARAEAYRSQILSKRLEFQHETLTELQNVTAKLGHMVSEAVNNDRVAFNGGQPWGSKLRPDEWPEKLRSTLVDLTILLSRVRDGKIRSLADQMRSHASTAGSIRDKVQSEILLTKMHQVQSDLILRIGEILREIADLADSMLV